jgi:membrane protein implicated in regulation of membrane protease activity
VTIDGDASRQRTCLVAGTDRMSTKTASRILLSMLILGPWLLSGYYIIEGYVLYGVLLFVLGLIFLLWLWKPWQSRKHKRNTQTKRGSDRVKHS